jgi:hypothetical protein
MHTELTLLDQHLVSQADSILLTTTSATRIEITELPGFLSIQNSSDRRFQLLRQMASKLCTHALALVIGTGI